MEPERVGGAGQMRAFLWLGHAAQDDGDTAEGLPGAQRAHEVEGAPVGEGHVDEDRRRATLRTSAIARATSGAGRG